MYKQNKLGIYVYPHNVYNINGIQFDVNSISIDEGYNSKQIFRIINAKFYCISLRKLYNNVQTK